MTYSCDNCYAPMIGHTHHRAEVCPHGDTDQCLLCSQCEDADALLEEIEALGEHPITEEVYEQICKLADRMNLLDARRERRLAERDHPREFAADLRRGL